MIQNKPNQPQDRRKRILENGQRLRFYDQDLFKLPAFNPKTNGHSLFPENAHTIEMYRAACSNWPNLLVTLQSTLPRLTNLRIVECEITDNELGFISTLHNLKVLNLNQNKIKGKGLRLLGGLKELDTLSLLGNPLDEDSVRNLSRLTGKLTTLMLSAKEIGDYEGEKYLCRYSQLKFLYLYECKFTDRAVLELTYRLKKLGVLNFGQTKLNQQLKRWFERNPRKNIKVFPNQWNRQW